MKFLIILAYLMVWMDGVQASQKATSLSNCRTKLQQAISVSEFDLQKTEDRLDFILKVWQKNKASIELSMQSGVNLWTAIETLLQNQSGSALSALTQDLFTPQAIFSAQLEGKTLVVERLPKLAAFLLAQDLNDFYNYSVSDLTLLREASFFALRDSSLNSEVLGYILVIKVQAAVDGKKLFVPMIMSWPKKSLSQLQFRTILALIKASDPDYLKTEHFLFKTNVADLLKPHLKQNFLNLEVSLPQMPEGWKKIDDSYFGSPIQYAQMGKLASDDAYVPEVTKSQSIYFVNNNELTSKIDLAVFAYYLTQKADVDPMLSESILNVLNLTENEMEAVSALVTIPKTRRISIEQWNLLIHNFKFTVDDLIKFAPDFAPKIVIELIQDYPSFFIKQKLRFHPSLQALLQEYFAQFIDDSTVEELWNSSEVSDRILIQLMLKHSVALESYTPTEFTVLLKDQVLFPDKVWNEGAYQTSFLFQFLVRKFCRNLGNTASMARALEGLYDSTDQINIKFAQELVHFVNSHKAVAQKFPIVEVYQSVLDFYKQDKPARLDLVKWIDWGKDPKILSHHKAQYLLSRIGKKNEFFRFLESIPSEQRQMVWEEIGSISSFSIFYVIAQAYGVENILLDYSIPENFLFIRDDALSFEMSTAPVTLLQWILVMGETPPVRGKNWTIEKIKELRPTELDIFKRPVTDMSWESAAFYLNAFSKLMGYESCFQFDGAEFEGDAAKGTLRASDNKSIIVEPNAGGFHFGKVENYEQIARRSGLSKITTSKQNHYFAHFVETATALRPIGEKRPIELGFSDFIGNAAMWTSSVDQNNSMGIFMRTVFGGSWINSADELLNTNGYIPGQGHSDVGFRSVRRLK